MDNAQGRRTGAGGADYVVEGARVMCSNGSATPKLKTASKSRIGSKLRIVDTDTGMESFDGNFGICSSSGGRPCKMKLFPKWLNTNFQFVSGSDKPCVTMDSFVVCTAGAGVIVPMEHGQSMDDFDFENFANRLPSDLQSIFKGIVSGQVLGVDPVNMSTGNFVYSKTDIEIPGRFPLAFRRFYNSMDDTDGMLGRNWTHNYNIFLYTEDETVKIAFGDGHVEEYYQRDDGTYLSSPDHLNTLKRDGDGHILTLPSGIRYCFNERGKPASLSDLNGNTTKLSYNGSGFLTDVSNICGKLSFSYNPIGQIAGIADHAGRTVQYLYDEHLLISVTDPSGAIYRYEYGADGKIGSIVDPQGTSIIRNEYDEYDRTVKQYFPDGGVAAVAYDARRRATAATEQNGNQIIYEYDEDYRTVKIVYGDSEEHFEYNKNNKRTLNTDRNGNSWRSDYDNRGNLILMTDPLGNSTRTEYNELNKPTKLTGPSGCVTKHEYDEKGNPVRSIDPLQRELRFAYDDSGLLVGLTLPDNSITSVEYDERGNITAIFDADGNAVRHAYDSLNRAVKTTDGEGHSTLFEYNAKGDVTKVTDAHGNTRLYEYNPAGKITKITDFDGSVVEYGYNSLGKIEEIVNRSGGRTRFAYDSMWNVTCVTDPNGNTIKYVYDPYQRAVRSYDAESNVSGYEYDSKGNVTAIISSVGAVTEIKYDASDRPSEITEPDGAVTKMEYDKAGNLVKITDALGNAETREYDIAGGLIGLTDALGNKTEFTYTALGQIASIVDPKGGTRTYTYYPGGKPKSVTMPGGERETYEYDKNGNTIKITDASGYQTSPVYDSLGRITEVVNPLGHGIKFGYDALGNVTSFTDEAGHTIQRKYSVAGDVIEIIDEAGHSRKYDYDGMGRLSGVKTSRMVENPARKGTAYPEYRTTTYERNKKGEITEIKSPLGGVVKFRYDKAGNLISKTDEDGFETLYKYNRAGKLAKVRYADGNTAEFGYDALKRLTSVRDRLGTTTFVLDKAGRPVRVTDFEGKSVEYAWNELGQKEKLVYPDGGEVRYEYDISGRLSRVSAGPDVTSYAYDVAGRLRERILPNGTVTKYEVDALGRIESLTHGKDGEILDRFRFAYDPAGNITRIEKHRAGFEADSGVFEYSYDSLGQLIAAAHGDRVRRYRYDELGNRVKSWIGGKYDAGESTLHDHNALNRLIRTREGDDVREYRYDGRGNLTEIIENGQLQARYVFDATNMMTEAFAVGKGRAEYVYDGLRNRVKKIEEIQGADDKVKEIRYVLDMTRPYDNLLMTRGAQNQSFVWGNDLISAIGDEKYYYLQDHLGSPIRLLGDDGAGTPLAYDEFGVPLAGAAQGGRGLHNPFGFAGYQTDNITGFYYAQERYYNPFRGGFVSQDPIRSGLNFYSYCTNNPIAFIDPLGLEAEFIGQIYKAEGIVKGEPSVYVGSTAQEIKERFSTHKWKEFINDPATKVTVQDVYADFSGLKNVDGTIRAATSRDINRALRAPEQAVLNEIVEMKNNGAEITIKNRINAATPDHMFEWETTYSTTIGEWEITKLENGVRVRTENNAVGGAGIKMRIGSSALGGAFVLLGAVDMAREMSNDKYIQAPYLFEDVGGVYTMSQQSGFLGFSEKYYKNYTEGGFAGHSLSVDKDEYDFAKKETEALYGYVDFWGNFVPGLLRTELPVIEVRSSPDYTA